MQLEYESKIYKPVKKRGLSPLEGQIEISKGHPQIKLPSARMYVDAVLQDWLGGLKSLTTKADWLSCMCGRITIYVRAAERSHEMNLMFAFIVGRNAPAKPQSRYE